MPDLSRRDLLAATAAGVAIPLGRPARAQGKPSEIKVGMATFLSGGASVFGVPGRNAAELFVDRLNKAGGIAGVPVRLIVIDEGPGVDHVVGEIRRLVQNERVDALLTGISSGTCLACAPLNEELKVPTLLWDCGTQRIFEERSYEFVARSQANATPVRRAKRATRPWIELRRTIRSVPHQACIQSGVKIPDFRRPGKRACNRRHGTPRGR
mgnify:CR=1 FL=1